ncbi:MAG: ABC transporter ATP-binding protein [Clostridia bacterium]|nr:ABC transporter ATP-binding protein [Clostridia bacterium]
MDLKAENISKRYFRKTGGANYFYAVQPVSLTLPSGAVTVLTGRSGSGKTTLLHMLAGLLTPTEGKVLLGDTDLYALSDVALSRLRNEKTGVVPQGRSAVDTLTVRENIVLPALLYGRPAPAEAAAQWMERLDIAQLADAYPAQLSGGELRRMAIARALAQEPEIIFADEPTGDLDDENTAAVLSALQAAARQGKAVFLVTHEAEALRYADRAFRMDGGALREISLSDGHL